jgi:CubicO group peptidase (beta-lactamase class C family)
MIGFAQKASEISKPLAICPSLHYNPSITQPENTMLPTASPEVVGMSSERLQRAFGILQSWLHEGVVTAIAAVVARRGKIAGEFYRGKLSAEPDAKSVTPATLFHLTSIGKPMTAAAVMLLVEAGQLSLDDRVAELIPAFAGAGRDAITVRHLLTHTSGLPQDPGPEILDGLPPEADTPTQLRNYPNSKLAVPTGSKVEYSNVGYGMLGLVIEAVSGQPFPVCMRERLFTPAGMSDAHLPAPESLYPRIAVVGGTPGPGSPTERFNSAYARRATHPAGSVVGTADDVVSFFQLFLDDGQAHGRTIIAPASARLMTANHTPGLCGGIEGFMTWPDCAWGLGFDIRGVKHPHFSGEFSSAQTFGHTGVSGNFAWADPSRELVCVLLANRLLHNRWNEPRWSRYSTAVVAAITEI